jgi:tetratricopeptide (TPR) repeat protein
MKIIRSFAPVGVSAGLLLAACSTPNNMTKNAYTTSPNPLEAKGDTISVTIDANVPAKSFNNKAVLTFQPYLKTAGGSEIPLKEYTVAGAKAKGNADVKIDSKTGGKISYSDRIAYKPEMRRSTLYPRFKFNTVNVPVANAPLAEGVITTAYLVKASDKPIYNTENYGAVTSNKSENIYFLINSSKFNPNYKSGKDISNKKQLAALKTDLKKDANWVAKGITVNGFASPDGSMAINEPLSKARAESTFKYFRKEMKKLGFAEANDSNFVLGYTTAEDWDGFTKEIEQSNLSDKNDLLNIIHSNSGDEREAAMKRDHMKSWKYCADKLLPKLRRSELVIRGSNPVKTDQELTGYYGKYDQLSPEETYHLAMISKENDKKIDALNAYVSKKTDDWKGYSDLAAAQIEAGKYDDAISNLDKANQMNPNNGTVLANYGVAYKLKGDRAKAEQYYRDAMSKGADVNYHMGILAIQKGNYAEAVSLMKNKNDFNAALANLLNGDPTTAKNIIDGMNPDELDWSCYYLRAVAGARMNNQDVCTTNLAKAVSMNPDVRKMAKDDVEFIKFWSNPLFEAAIR